jgi:hypothetical protein
MKCILDRSLCYTPSFDTDVRRTFARIRRERREDRPIRCDAGTNSVAGANARSESRRVEWESMQSAN